MKKKEEALLIILMSAILVGNWSFITSWTIWSDYKARDAIEEQVKQEARVRLDSYIIMEVEATGYDPGKCCCGKFADGLTATGTDAYKAGIAVDPKVIPYGSMVYITEIGGWLKADDCGSAIKGAKIDIRFPTHKIALEWGRKKIKIWIKPPEESK